MAFQCDAFQENAFQNDCGAAEIAIATGGWRGPGRWPREERESERERRVKAERIRLGILPPDREAPTAVERARGEISGVPATGVTPDPRLALDLAELHTGAYLDEEIRRHFRLQDLDDEEALFAIMAIAETLH